MWLAPSSAASPPAVVASQQVRVAAWEFTFRPTSANETVFTAQTTIGVTAGDDYQAFPLSFQGTGTGALVDVSPRTIDFGSWFIGQPVTVPVTFTNRNAQTVNFGGGGFSSSNGFVSNSGTCGGSLAAGASCIFNFSFTPPQVGLITNATGISATTTGDSPISELYSINVRGTGTASVNLVSAAPVAVDFGTVQTGREMVVPFAFKNFDAGTINFGGGGVEQEGDGIAFTGFNGGGAGCGSGTATSGATCTTNYHFRPREPRSYTAGSSREFSKTGVFQNVSFSFTGRGSGPIAQVTPIDIVFGDVEPGTNMTVPVTITNTGDLALVNFVGGSVLEPFSVTNDCPSSLAVGASCHYNYRFDSFDSLPRSAVTLLSFTNVTGIQPITTIRTFANGAPEPGTTLLGSAALSALAVLRGRRRSQRA